VTIDTATATPETLDQLDDEDAAMAAGFNAIRNDAAHAQAAADAFVAEVEKDPAPAVATPASETTQAAVQALPDDETAALKARVAEFSSLKSGLDTLAGTVGGLKRTLLQLQEIQKNSAPQSAAARGALKLEAAMVKELAEDYPDIAEKLLPALERIVGAAGPAPAASDEVIALREKVSSMEEKMEKRELRALSRAHPNWETNLVGAKDEYGEVIRNSDGQVVPSRAYVQWLGTKSPEFRKEFTNTDDADFVAAGLTEFKTFKDSSSAPASTPAPTPAPAPAPAAAATNSRQAKQARLAAAVVVAGTPAPVGAAPTPSEDEDMELGFRNVRGR
jgi:hypothetical protein